MATSDHRAEPPPEPPAAVLRSAGARDGEQDGAGSSAVFVVLRRLRAPLILVIAIYTVSITGLMLIPGVDAEGRPAAPMSFFHAFYFISYTASTIGFGELPLPFSDAQRLWVTGVIYMSVIGWSYLVVSLIALVQDRGLNATLAANRFSRQVRRIQEPFHLLCGGGATGLLIARNLAARNRMCVIVDIDEQRVQELDLEDLSTDPPLFAADARQPEHLIRAGLRHPQCVGVLAVTDDDHANLAVAISAKLLHPEYAVVARVTDPAVANNLASFGTDHIVNPFAEFARELALSVRAPEQFRLSEVVTGLHRDQLPSRPVPPRGTWLVVGFGRFGRLVATELSDLGLPIVVIDPAAERSPLPPGVVRMVTGSGTEAATLEEAGVRDVVGIVAATDDDVDNLSILITARELNPALFLVNRQNRVSNRALFDAFPVHATMIASRIVAEEAMVLVTSPLINRFDQYLRDREEAWCADLTARLEALGRGRIPAFWDVEIGPRRQGVFAWLAAGRRVLISDLLRDHRDRDTPLHAIALLHERGTSGQLLPAGDAEVRIGDRLLLAGTDRARQRMLLALDNRNVFDTMLTGVEQHGWLWRRLGGRAARSDRPAGSPSGGEAADAGPADRTPVP